VPPGPNGRFAIALPVPTWASPQVAFASSVVALEISDGSQPGTALWSNLMFFLSKSMTD
jgi:hypothetical protein